MPVLVLDFSQAPPRQGGGLPLIPPGPYVLRVTGAECGQSSRGNDMLTITLEIAEGPHAGTEFKDYFAPVPPPPGAKGKDLSGMQKLHAFILALGVKNLPPRGNFNTDKLIGMTCTANIATEPMQPTTEYPDPRDVSKIRTYELPSSYTNGAARNGTAPASPPPASAPRPLAEVPTANTAQEPVEAAQEASPPTVATSAPTETMTVAAESDDLFA